MKNFKNSLHAACVAIGVIDKTVPSDGRWYAADLVDDPRGRGDGRIKFFEDGQGGIVWNHKSGERTYFFINNKSITNLTSAENKALDNRREQRKKQEQKRHRQAAERALTLFNQSDACLFHPYLKKKQILPHGTRSGVWRKKHKDSDGQWRELVIKGALLLPMYNQQRQLVNVQAIFPEPCPALGRSKDFLAGGQLAGAFWWVGKKTKDIVCIAEGFATAATISQQTEYRTYIAFSANNLLAIGRIVRQKLPNAQIVFCADNDVKTPGNPGISKATQAAVAVDGFLAVPPGAGDFNDYAAAMYGVGDE